MTQRREHRRWGFKVAIRLVVAIAASAFVAANWHTATAAASALAQARPVPAALGIGVSTLAIINRGLLHRSTFHTVGLAPSTTDITRTSTVGYAANTVVRTGGLSGIAVFLRHGKQHGFPTARVVTACALGSLASLIGLGGLLAAAVVSLGVSGRLTGWWMAASAGYATYAAGVAVALVLAFRSKPMLLRLVRFGNRLRRRIGRHDNDVDEQAIEEFARALREARSNRLWFRRAVGHALVSKALGIIMLMAGAAAAGIEVSPHEAIVIYATALVASFASLFPGGVGTVEASVGALFVAAGVALPIAVVAVALYRLFDLWIPVLAGVGIARYEFRNVPVDHSLPAGVPVTT